MKLNMINDHSKQVIENTSILKNEQSSTNNFKQPLRLIVLCNTRWSARLKTIEALLQHF